MLNIRGFIQIFPYFCGLGNLNIGTATLISGHILWCNGGVQYSVHSSDFNTQG